MNNAKLIELAEKLESVASELRNMQSSKSNILQAKLIEPKIIKAVERLKVKNRNEANQELTNFSHSELGSILVCIGGAAKDKKYAKAKLIEKILWILFDFESEHNIIRVDRNN